MKPDAAALASLLQRLEATPHAGAIRLEAVVLANHLALDTRDPAWVDVAEALVEEEVPGSTRVLRSSLSEQAQLARSVRRALTRPEPSTEEFDRVNAQWLELARAANAAEAL